MGITLNKNMIADETRSAMDPSGIRFGTPAMTTRNMKETEAITVAKLMIETLRNKDNAEKKKALRNEVEALCMSFPVPESFV